MSNVTQAFRDHHAALSKELSEYVTSFARAEPTANPKQFAAFLKHELVPHAAGEEAELYPIVDDLVRAHGKPTSTMRVDHKYIQDYVAQIEAAAREYGDAAPAQQNALRAKLVQLGFELDAVFKVHLAKEEEVYLPLFEQYVSDEAQQRVLDAMHNNHAGATEVRRLL